LSESINKNSFKATFIRYCRQNNLSLTEDRSPQANHREYCYIKVAGDINTVELLLDAIAKNLKYTTGDFSIQIERKVIPGSAIFFGNGSILSMQRLISMFATGALTQIAGLNTLDLNYIKVWLERLFSSEWIDRETILAGSGNNSIRNLPNLSVATEHSLVKSRLIQIAENTNMIVSIELDYYSALAINVTCYIHPNLSSYLPSNLTIAILDTIGSHVMEERIERADIDAIELAFTISIDERFSLKIIYNNLEIIEQF
jgi:Protein of unknown function (DUF1822)